MPTNGLHQIMQRAGGSQLSSLNQIYWNPTFQHIFHMLSMKQMGCFCSLVMIKGSSGTHHTVSKGAVRRKEVELSPRNKYKGSQM